MQMMQENIFEYCKHNERSKLIQNPLQWLKYNTEA